MKIVSVLKDKKVEKRISITPEIAKKYISLGLKVCLPENYGVHLGFKDNEFKDAGEISERSIIMSTYLLCGFANFASIGIQIGGIGSLIPSRKGLLSKLGMRAL